ncbi:MAG: prephenate dehydratase [Pirellulales bacterium]
MGKRKPKSPAKTARDALAGPAAHPSLAANPDTPATSMTAAQRAAVERQLDALDRELLRLMNDRARLVQAIGVAPEDPGAADLVGRFHRSASWIDQHAEGPLAAESLRNVMSDLDGAIRAWLRPAKIAYLGPAYSFSHLAALERFGADAQLIPVGTIGAVFEEVHQGGADLGIVPIENSTDGRIVDTLEMFLQLPVKICGEVPLRIHHNLWSSGPREGIREVCSKPQALSQCRNWLAKHLPEARLVPVSSTTTAAEMASQRPDVAAIASGPAGAHYGLQLLAAKIEDRPDNVTRFAVIGSHPAPRTGRDKTSLMFELPHQPGALADAMAVFKRQGLNLTWIESFPKRQSPQEYLFFVELDGHPRQLQVRRALASLQKKAVRVDILGAYARSAIVG